GLALLLCLAVSRHGPLDTAVGGWDVPLGIALGADGLSGVFVVTAALILSAVGLFARRDFRAVPHETPGGYTFWPLFYAMWAALNAIFLGRDLFNFYVALELLTLAAVAMVAYGGTGSALRYLMFALMGSLAYLTGVGLIYASAATLDLGRLHLVIEADRAVMLGAALMTAGLLAKAALFPLHAWLPPAHGNAPAAASALLSALVVKAAFFIIVRIWFDMMPDAQSPWLTHTLGLLGMAAVIYGSLLAIRQERLKLIIAYSTVAQIGYLFFVFPLANGAAFALPWSAGAWSGVMFHAVSHAFAKAALFLAAGLVIEALGHDRIADMKGIARALPMTWLAFGIAAVSLMGLPPSGGFMAKYLILTSALAGGHVAYALVMIAGGLLAAVYLFRPLNAAMAGTSVPGIAPVSRCRQAIPLALSLVAIAIGLASSLPYEFLQIGLPEGAEEDDE
ncbi:MAG: complex I subunit 5 family protein, partial [Pigmentiphaga sp.]